MAVGRDVGGGPGVSVGAASVGVDMSKTRGSSVWTGCDELDAGWWAVDRSGEGTAAIIAGSRSSSTKQRYLPLIAAPDLGRQLAGSEPQLADAIISPEA